MTNNPMHHLASLKSQCEARRDGVIRMAREGSQKAKAKAHRQMVKDFPEINETLSQVLGIAALASAQLEEVKREFARHRRVEKVKAAILEGRGEVGFERKEGAAILTPRDLMGDDA